MVEIGVSMLNWFRGKATPSSAGTLECRVRFALAGLVLADSETDLPADLLDPRRVELVGLSRACWRNLMKKDWWLRRARRR